MFANCALLIPPGLTDIHPFAAALNVALLKPATPISVLAEVEPTPATFESAATTVHLLKAFVASFAGISAFANIKSPTSTACVKKSPSTFTTQKSP